MPVMSRFLIFFSGVQQNFRLPELQSICSVLHLDLTYDRAELDKERYLEVQTDERNVDKLAALAGRSVLITQITELWGHGPSINILRTSARQHLQKTGFDIPHDAWKFDFTISNKRGMDMATKMAYAEELGISFNGPIDLKSPKHTLDLYLDYGLSRVIPDRPLYYYFGRRVGGGGRGLVAQFDTKHRTFLGNTAMCPQMAFLMANQAKVNSNMLVLDPFVGSGGISLACAKFGGYCLGSDINHTLLRGKGLSSRGHGFRLEDENMWTCFEKFGLLANLVGSVGCDQHTPAWRRSMQVDAIVTDPPYGIRESPRKVGTDGTSQKYAMAALVEDLLKFSDQHLRPGGRLVYFLPVVTSLYSEGEIPGHPNFDLVSASLESMIGGFSRVLVTMEKVDREGPVDDVTWREQCRSLDSDVRKECFREREVRNEQRRQQREERSAEQVIPPG